MAPDLAGAARIFWPHPVCVGSRGVSNCDLPWNRMTVRHSFGVLVPTKKWSV